MSYCSYINTHKKMLLVCLFVLQPLVDESSSAEDLSLCEANILVNASAS